jgi:acyl carrier protein
MEKKLIEFIKNEFVTDPEIEIFPETKLISSGIVDSFSLFSLQSYIEREFGKKIPPPLITADSFDTVKQMIEIIEKY